MKETDIDQQLFERIRSGDEGAFRVLFMKYFARLCAFVHTIVRAEQKAQDVVQKVFVKLWEKRKFLMIAKTVFGYLMSSCKNEAFNYLKMEKTRQKYEEQYATDYQAAEAYEMRIGEGGEIGFLVNRAIEELPEKCKQIYTLSKKDGLSYKEIADFLKISEKTVENQIGIALRKLREALTPHLNLINE
ncbi:MAG: RNA polymerase sigma-70 factor [Bacteroidota bacterium]